MANVFTRSNDATPKPNRTTFDLSHVNNLTLKMGQITPCICKPVMPGDSARIDATFGFNLMPTVFPVQSDMMVNMHLFYVRNRALWRGWQDFITKTDNIDGDTVPPYIQLTDENRDMFNTGEIGDYLGVPTVYYGREHILDVFPINYVPNGNSIYAIPAYSSRTTPTYYDELLTMVAAPEFEMTTDLAMKLVNAMENSMSPRQLPLVTYSASRNPYKYIPFKWAWLKNGSTVVNIYASWLDILSRLNYPSLTVESFYRTADIHAGSVIVYDTLDKQIIRNIGFEVKRENSDFIFNDVSGGVRLSTDSQQIFIEFDEPLLGNERYKLFVLPYIATVSGTEITADNVDSDGIGGYRAVIDTSYGVENSGRELIDLPFASTANPDGLRISALPFRAVEACYNSFYRDDRNNPLIIDGKPYYNMFTQNKNGGADTTHYHMYQRNWEADVFTTAVQSPQQGVAPLVGVTGSGVMTFQDEDGKTYTLTPTIGEDGHTITGISSYSSDMPVGTLRAMVDTISSGISINDFRNVNALQRWLETNMRKGLRYKEQIEAHFGTSPTYSELDMPEFIGGMSRKVEMHKVISTAATEGAPLGSLAGSATVLGSDGQKIEKYFDEHGYIIGFITITPKPVYSQQLSKDLLKTELLDYYFPEFAHIGYQPILNQEVAPLQCNSTEGSKLNDVFGYQRAWYEYLASVDEVHGDFRNNLRNYLVQRVFDGVPQLGEEFLTISTDEANDIFANQSDNAKIFGQIYFDIKMKRPIPAIGIPRLEVG